MLPVAARHLRLLQERRGSRSFRLFMLRSQPGFYSGIEDEVETIAAAFAKMGIGAGPADAQPSEPVFAERQPGSALVHPLFDVNNDPGNARSTLLKLSNLGDEDVWVHLVRVCAGIESYGAQGLCQASNRQVELTAGETFVRDVAGFFSTHRDNCPTDYIVLPRALTGNEAACRGRARR